MRYDVEVARTEFDKDLGLMTEDTEMISADFLPTGTQGAPTGCR